MILDLKNNELIFSKMRDLGEFRTNLKEMKGVKAREYNKKFYISLEHFYEVRRVLGAKYGKGLSYTISYEKFAKRFVLTKEPIDIIWTPATCYIKGEHMPWKDIIPITSYFNKTAKRTKSFGKSWSGYEHLFNPVTGEFPSGLLERVINVLNKHQIQYNISQTFSYPSPYLTINPAFPFEPTKDQVDSVEALYKANTGIGKLPTGFGKTSYVAASLIARKGVRSLFMVNQRVLSDDAKKDFDEVFAGNDLTIGLIGDGLFEPGDITIASIQTIASALQPPTNKERQVVQHQLELAKRRLQLLEDDEMIVNTKKDIKRFQSRLISIDKKIKRHKELLPFLKKVDLFIVDEAQVLGTDQWKMFLNTCPAPYRYTLSATPVRTDGGGIEIVAATGELRYESSAAEQIEKGRLAEFIGHFRKFDHKVNMDIIKQVKMDYHQAYELFIVYNDKRNDHLCDKVIQWAKQNSVLALVTRKVHGEIIQNMLINKGMNPNDIRFIDGDTKKKIRRDTIEDYRNGKFPVLIGTSVFDVGFNAKNAAKMVRFNAGQSEVKEPQRAGRTVRKRVDDSIGETYDLIDINVPFFEAQAWKRLRILRQEFGEERVKFHSGIIEGELNVVHLKEIVAANPNEEERIREEEIIALLDIDENYIPNDNPIDLNSLPPELMKVVNMLKMN